MFVVCVRCSYGQTHEPRLDDDDGSERERAGLTSQVSGADVTWRAVTWGHVTVSPLRRYFRPKVVSGVDCTAVQ